MVWLSNKAVCSYNSYLLPFPLPQLWCKSICSPVLEESRQVCLQPHGNFAQSAAGTLPPDLAEVITELIARQRDPNQRRLQQKPSLYPVLPMHYIFAVFKEGSIVYRILNIVLAPRDALAPSSEGRSPLCPPFSLALFRLHYTPAPHYIFLVRMTPYPGHSCAVSCPFISQPAK